MLRFSVERTAEATVVNVEHVDSSLDPAVFSSVEELAVGASYEDVTAAVDDCIIAAGRFDVDEYRSVVVGHCVNEADRRYSLGFSYAGETFSLSAAAQRNHGTMSISTSAYLAAFPGGVPAQTIDDSATLLLDESSLSDFLNAALAARISIYGDCVATRVAVAGADPTKAAIDAAAADWLPGS